MSVEDFFKENMRRRRCRWCWARHLYNAIWAEMMEALMNGERENDNGGNNDKNSG